eukprot:2717794-Rhodomonas_salina.1
MPGTDLAYAAVWYAMSGTAWRTLLCAYARGAGNGTEIGCRRAMEGEAGWLRRYRWRPPS